MAAKQNSSGKQNGNRQNNRNRNRNRGRNQNNRSKGQRKKVDHQAFWGNEDSLPEVEGFETTTPDPVAVIASLGQPPFPGHGGAALHYFKAVYERSTQLGSALAMAGAIEDLTPELTEESGDLVADPAKGSSDESE